MVPCGTLPSSHLWSQSRTGKKVAKFRWVGALRSYIITKRNLSACPWDCVLCVAGAASLKMAQEVTLPMRKGTFGRPPAIGRSGAGFSSPEPPNATSRNSYQSSASIIQTLVSKSVQLPGNGILKNILTEVLVGTAQRLETHVDRHGRPPPRSIPVIELSSACL